MKTHLTLSQRIHNAEGMQAAEYLHARHTYLHATSYCKEEWGEFWDTSEEASWGHLFGVMCGFDEIWYNSVSNYDPDGFRGYINLVKQHPEISWFDARSMREISMHTLATDIIEAADMGGPMDVCNPGMDAYNKLMGIGGGPGGPGPGPGPGPGAGGPPQGQGGAPGAGGPPPQGMGGAPGAGGPPQGGAPHGDGNAQVPGMVVKEKGATRGATSAGGAKGEVHVKVPGPIHFNYTPIMHVQNTVPWPEPYKTMDREHTYRIYETPKVD